MIFSINRATVRIFIATHGDLHKTKKFLRPFYEKYTTVLYVDKYISNVIQSTKFQHKTGRNPPFKLPSWSSPKSSDTYYHKPDETGIVASQLVDLDFDKINWEMINWDLIDEISKDYINHKLMLRPL